MPASFFIWRVVFFQSYFNRQDADNHKDRGIDTDEVNATILSRIFL